MLFSICVFWSFQNIPQALGSIWVNFGEFSKTIDYEHLI
jgi:hypothetical protein